MPHFRPNRGPFLALPSGIQLDILIAQAVHPHGDRKGILVSTQFSIRAFFRQMPNTLLARYFHARNVLTDTDFGTIKETDSNTLFGAWMTLAGEQRAATEADFRDIFELGTASGWLAILDEARWQFARDTERLAAFEHEMPLLPDHPSRAMTAFLDHAEVWRGARMFSHADNLGRWRKRGNLPHRPASVDEASAQALATGIKNYFQTTEGRGRNCAVEMYKRGERDYFFAYPEDHSQRSIEWSAEGTFTPRPRNPAFEIVFVYSQAQGTLDMNVRGANKVVEALQAIFAKSILKMDDLPPDPKDDRIYDLKPMAARDFVFARKAGDGIEKVVLRKLRLRSLVRDGEEITLAADAHRNSAAVHDMMERIGQHEPLHLYRVQQAELCASIGQEGRAKPRRITFYITYPNTCSLKYDDMDLRLRQMLEASGIEPRSPEALEPAA